MTLGGGVVAPAAAGRNAGGSKEGKVRMKMKMDVNKRTGKSRMILAGAVLLLAAGAGAQALVDDLEGGNSINRFGGQWSFSGDFWDKGNSKILSAVDTAAEIPFFKGSYGGGYPGGTGNAAELRFRFGTVKPGTPPDTYDNNVNMSSPFGPDDAVLNLTGAQSITFYARSSKALQVEVALPTANITDYAYYSAMIATTSAWTKYTIKLATGAGGLTRRPFGVNKPLDLSQASAVTWEINKGKNASVTEATLWVDDVTIQGYTFVAPEPRGSCIVNGCVVLAGNIPQPSALLADFDHGDAAQNAVGLPWTFGTAIPMSGSAKASEITSGIDPANYTLIPAGQGYGASNGGMIGFTLGDNWFTPEGFLQLPAVNITTQLTSDTSLDATGATGIYFDYKTTGDVEYVDFKLRTTQIHADNIYAVAYVKLKATGGQWKGANVKWSDFILPNWGAPFKESEKAMHFDGLVGMEWSVTSARKAVAGSLAIDDIYLTGIPKLPDPVASVRASVPMQPAGRANLSQGSLNVPFQAPAGIHAGVVRMTDLSGKVVFSRDFTAEGSSVGTTMRFGLEHALPRGMYLILIDSHYGEGRAFSSRQSAVVME
ncbi:MAG: hypothetical protein JWP91_1806 [Fibrobacteres bacterium]|nr:hypothetical protein [Fibrobacterota bacterium]